MCHVCVLFSVTTLYYINYGFVKFLKKILEIKNNEQHTATDLVNLV